MTNRTKKLSRGFVALGTALSLGACSDPDGENLDVNFDDVTTDVGQDTGVDADLGTGDTGDMGLDMESEVGADMAPDQDASDVSVDSPIEDMGGADVDDAGADTADTPVVSTLRLPAVSPNPVNVERNVRIAPAITLPRATGGEPPYLYRTSPLPGGIDFDRDALTLRGTPLFEGSTGVSFTVRDSDGVEVSRSFVLNVTPDMTGPLPPTGARFSDVETVPSAVRPDDFQMSWTLSRSPDVSAQHLHIIPDDGGTDFGAPIAVLTDIASFYTFEANQDSLGQCLTADTEYVAAFVMVDRQTPPNQSPVDVNSPSSGEEAHYFRFTSAPADGTNVITGGLFDEDELSGEASPWEIYAEGPSSSVTATHDATDDAGSCGSSGSVLVSNDSDGGSEVTGATVAVLGQCVPVDDSLGYGFSAEMRVEAEQGRRGFAVVNVTWYAGEDCTVGALGNDALPTVEDSDGEWIFRSTTLTPEAGALSATVEIRLLKQPVNESEVGSTPFEGWFDNLFFGPID